MNQETEEPKVDFAIFSPVLIVVLASAIPLMIFPQPAAKAVMFARTFIMDNFLWLYLVAGLSALAFCLWLAFGRYGNVKLGQANEEPEYSNIHWIAMMFTAAIGASVIAWGLSLIHI